MTRARDIADLAGGGTLLTRQLFTATAGQTTFTPSAGYNPGALEVFMNGLMLLASDYTATNSSTVVLGVAANAGDEVEILTYQINTIGDTISASSGGTISSPITVNRNTTDGDILSFNKDGTAVGSIGVGYGVVDIKGGTSGLLMGNAAVLPVNGSGTLTTDSYDIGLGSFRFKDAYLSGGVYLGGTGAANKLDDYEEGTWTPTMTGATFSTNRTCRYTKIGNLVNLDLAVETTAVGNTHLQISGLPFDSITGVWGGDIWTNGWSSEPGHVRYWAGSTSIAFYQSNGSGGVNAINQSMIGTGGNIFGTITYMTNS